MPDVCMRSTIFLTFLFRIFRIRVRFLMCTLFSLFLDYFSHKIHHHSYKEDTLVPNALDSPFPTLCPVLDSLGIATHSLSPQIVRRHCLTLKAFRNMCSVTSSESMMKVKTENVSSNSVSLVVTAKFDSTQKAYNLHCELRT